MQESALLDNTNSIDSCISSDLHSFLTATCMCCFNEIVIPAWCGDRFCEVCNKARSHKYIQILKKKVYEQQKLNGHVRFITLTIKNTKRVADGYKQLNTYFDKLRERKLWTSNVNGGASGIEVTYNTRHNSWHVHAHIIYDGNYIPQSVLRDTWYDITGDSFVVDIKDVKNPKKAIRYIGKYPFKPGNVKYWPQEAKDEYSDFMVRKRLWRTFGSWYGIGYKKYCKNCGSDEGFVVIDFEVPYHLNDYFARIFKNLDDFG